MRDECQACGRDIHICLNCDLNDANAYRQCPESIKEPAPDKERANFCDFFRASQRGAAQAYSACEDIQKLKDLFN